MRSVRRSESGVGRLTLLVFGTIVGVIVYAGFKIIPFFYYYYDIQNQADSIVKLAGYETDDYIRNRLWHDIKKAGIPVYPEDLRIFRQGSDMIISMRYTEVFYIKWRGKYYDLWMFPFHVSARGAYWQPK